MHALTNWFIRNPVAANLIMAVILISGYLTLTSIRIEGFPKLPADTITIETSFVNSYATQVDEQVTQKIEKALEGLDGVKKVISTSVDGHSSVHVQKNSDIKLQKLLDDIRIRIDGVATLPQSAERPVITRNDFDFPAMTVQLYGQTEQITLQRLSLRLKEELLEQPEISRLQIWGQKEPEIRIEVKPYILEKYNLSIQDVIAKIRESSLLFESGTLKTKGGHISLRADNQAYFQRDFAKIPIIDRHDGAQIFLGDIAAIVDDYEDDDVIVRFDGVPAVGMEVLIGRKENLLDIAVVVNKVVEQFRTQIPPEVNVSIWGDSSVYISERLSLLQKNAIQGLILVMVLLALFLNVKLAFWVAMGIPISVAGAMAVMGTKWIDFSLNDITTFGFIIALGILVDDAVVVGESVFEERRKHKDPIVGTQKGVGRVATATIFGVLTTVAAFYPMLLINNAMGKILASFSGVVILALLFSLFESKFILPAHLAHISLDKSKNSNLVSRIWGRIQGVAQGGLNHFRYKIYAPVLEWSIKQRYAIFILFLAAATLGIGLVVKGKVNVVFFQEVPGQLITVKVEMDARAPYKMTLNNINLIEDIGNQINEEYVAKGIVDEKPIAHILTVVSGAYKGEIIAELTPSAIRENLNSTDIMKLWQERVGRLEGTTNLSFFGFEETGGGFAIRLFSKDGQALRAASDEVMGYLQGIEGVRNLRDTLKGGKPELHLKVKPEALHLGFTPETLSMQIGNRFGGAEAQRIQRKGQEVKVIVKNTADARRTMDDLMQTRLKSNDGKWFPLISVASFSSGYATDYISRYNGKRVNTVQANIDKSVVSPSEISQSLFETLVPKLQEKYPVVEVKPGGELEEEGELKGSLIRALIMTCIMIYVLMAIPLKSYMQPFVIMSVVPFGFVGATLGHYIMGLPLSLLSFFGMLALTGVVVNDSLVMMTRYNQARSEEGMNVHDAVFAAGVGRFQAIFLTTVTTVAGLMPLLSETSEQAQYLIPAAVSLAYGEIFATTITLILIPVLIAISADISKFLPKNR
ncbi:MAG: efflux RND transporter permease subunit [Alphaproteobacteria bacterium]